MSDRSSPDAAMFRKAMSRFATGIAVITAASGEGVAGITVNSFTSVSLRPPIVLWCLDDGASRFDTFAGAEIWGVSILGAGQKDVSERFSRSNAPLADPEVIARLGADVPVVAGALAQFACQTIARHVMGDHLVIAGAVHDSAAIDGDALTYFASRYGLARAD